MRLTILFLFMMYISFGNSAVAASDFNYLALNNTDKAISNTVIDNPFNGQNNLYEQIFNTLNSEYEHIGRLSAQKVLSDKLTISGGLNSVGFSYRRPFAEFSIDLNRVVAPEVDSNKWIVTDSLTIHIDASKILNKLSNQNSIDITKENLALFAGIVFERKFVWNHYANSYDEGLSTHFEKLFFPFIGINFNSIQKLLPNEIVTKVDSISVNAGGFVSAPIYTGVTAMGGVLAKFQKLSRMDMTRKVDETGLDILMLSFEKSKSITAGVSLQVQADFLKILKMTLLSYEVDYSLNKTYRINTSFPMDEIVAMDSKDPVVNEIQNMIKVKEPKLEIIAKYIISEAMKIEQVISHKYNFLLLGGTKNAKTEHTEIASHGIVRTFFSHNYEKIKYTEDALSRLISSFIFKIFNTDLKAANLVSESKSVNIQYNSEKNLLENHEDINIGITKSQTLSLSFEGNYMTKKTSGMFGKKYRDRAKFILEHYSGVDPVALSLIDNNTLVAPYNVDGNYQVTTNGIRTFNSLSVGYVFDQFEGVCHDKPKTLFSNFLSLFDNCRRSLQNDYIDYLKDLSHDKISTDLINNCEKKAFKYLFSPGKKRAFIKSCLADLSIKEEKDWINIPLWPLKNFSQNLVNNVNNKIYYFNLFGNENVFFYGTFTAKTENAGDFITYFHEGKFKGFGVIDNYLRETDIRSPASVVIDQ